MHVIYSASLNKPLQISEWLCYNNVLQHHVHVHVLLAAGCSSRPRIAARPYDIIAERSLLGTWWKYCEFSYIHPYWPRPSWNNNNNNNNINNNNVSTKANSEFCDSQCTAWACSSNGGEASGQARCGRSRLSRHVQDRLPLYNRYYNDSVCNFERLPTSSPWTSQYARSADLQPLQHRATLAQSQLPLSSPGGHPRNGETRGTNRVSGRIEQTSRLQQSRTFRRTADCQKV